MLCNNVVGYIGVVGVNPNIENAVKAEMIATYQGLHQQIAQTNNLTMKEDTKMTFDPNKPVSLEEYNATLSHGYIMTYEHMKTDPTLSQEEFVQQASAMSEKYHEAIQEFQEAQDIQNGVNMNEGIQSDSENLGAETVPNVGAETTDIEVSDGSISTSGVDNTDGIDNEGIDDSMDI